MGGLSVLFHSRPSSLLFAVVFSADVEVFRLFYLPSSSSTTMLDDRYGGYRGSIERDELDGEKVRIERRM